ncbi:unnamed protein product, partial [Prorocentrum cordatum]
MAGPCAGGGLAEGTAAGSPGSPAGGGVAALGGASAPSGPARVRVVLVEPRDARNVGMSARACANFGATDFFVVHEAKFQAALGRAGRSEEKARQLGVQVGAGEEDAAAGCSLDLSAWKGVERLATAEGAEVLRRARLFGGLRAALAGAGRSVAFSGRTGDNFRRSSIELRDLAMQDCSLSLSLSLRPPASCRPVLSSC